MTAAEHRAFEVRQEDDVVPGRRVLVVAVVAGVVALVGVGASTWLLDATTGAVRESGARAVAGRRIANVEQTDIVGSRDGLDLRDRQRDALGRAQWVDRDAGIVSLPIDEAMDLVVRGGGQRR